MSTPVLHVLAGPNGAGKSTFVTRLLQPVTHLPFVNADIIATERWPGAQVEHAYLAARAAAEERRRLLERHSSFIAETVFSHPSKIDLVQHAVDRGYVVYLHAILVPVELSVHRVAERVRRGGHDVPGEKIRERYNRLWPLVATACTLADRAELYDNSLAATPFRPIASYERGRLTRTPSWPTWTPPTLID